ncbi:MAG: thermonuclease family protein [Candidatus Reddybacter sp.]
MIKYLWLFLLSAGIQAAPVTDAITDFKVLYTYDGDSFKIDLPVAGCIYDVLCRDLMVRVIGIDTPEIRGAKCDEEKIKALAARDFVSQLLGEAKTVQLTRVKRDGRFRLDAVVLVDGVDLALIVINAGHGEFYSGKKARTANWCG